MDKLQFHMVKTLILVIGLAALAGIAYFMATTHVAHRVCHLKVENKSKESASITFTMDGQSFSVTDLPDGAVHNTTFIVNKAGKLHIAAKLSTGIISLGDYGQFEPNKYGQQVNVTILPEAEIEFTQSE